MKTGSSLSLLLWTSTECLQESRRPDITLHFTLENQVKKTAREPSSECTPEVFTGSFVSGSGGTVQFGTYGSVEFQADGIVDASGNPYTGQVDVYGMYLDPTDENIFQTVPSDFYAIDQNDEQRILESYAMMHVELEGSNGEKLNISKPATMKFRVPESLQDRAPSSIPLWYMDEASSTWKEDGQASLQGEFYVGEVNHFSLWNCDVPNTYVEISGRIHLG